MDLVSTSWNVDDDILSMGRVCDAPKEKGRKISGEQCFLENPAGNPASSWPDWLGHLENFLFRHCHESGRIVTWYSGSQV